MIASRYNLNFSEVSRRLVTELKNYGFDIRDVLNAGVLSFNRLNSDDQKKAIAEVNKRHLSDKSLFEAIMADTKLSPSSKKRILELKKSAEEFSKPKKTLRPAKPSTSA